MPDQSVSQPVLYAVIAGLCGTIAFLFKLIVSHHSRSMDEARSERAALIAALKANGSAIDSNTKTTAQLMMSMFFLPGDFKKASESVLREIREREEKEKL